MKNKPKRIARITATSENRGKSRAMTSRLNANMPRKSIASRFCGVRNRSTLSEVSRADRSSACRPAIKILRVDRRLERLGRIVRPVVDDRHPHRADQGDDGRGIQERSPWAT